jgi:hypothetical protein
MNWLPRDATGWFVIKSEIPKVYIIETPIGVFISFVRYKTSLSLRVNK